MNILKKKYFFLILIALQSILLISSLFYLDQNVRDLSESNKNYIFHNVRQFLKSYLTENDTLIRTEIIGYIKNFPEIEQFHLYQGNFLILSYPVAESESNAYKIPAKSVEFDKTSVIAADTTIYEMAIDFEPQKSSIIIVLLVIILTVTLGMSLWLLLKVRFNREFLVPLLESFAEKPETDLSEFESPRYVVYQVLKKINEQQNKLNNFQDRIHFLNHIMDEINEPIIILNHEFEIIYANNRINSILEIGNQNNIDLKKILKKHYHEVISLLKAGEQITDLRIEYKDNQYTRYFLMNARMFQHMGKVYYVLIFDDRTEMILTQESLQETKVKLEKLNTSYAKKIIQLEQERYKNEKSLFYRYFLLETISELARLEALKDIGDLLIQKMRDYFEIAFGAFYILESGDACKRITMKNFSNFKIDIDQVVNIEKSNLDSIFEQNFPFILDEESIKKKKIKFFRFPEDVQLQGLILPVLEHERRMGFLIIFKFPDELFSMDEINVLDAMSKHISIILYNQFLLGELNQKTRHLESALEDLKRSQERVLQLQKMESLERLVGGIAHDFNNILGIIIPTSELLLLHSSLSDEDKEKVEMIRDAAKRASVLTRQFMLFGKEQKSILYPLNLNKYIEDSMFLFSKMLDEDIKLVFKPSSREIWVQADKTQIFQVISNMIINSVDAIKGHNIINGKIEIGIFDKGHPDFLKYLKQVKFDSDAVGFYIKDNGPGIPESIRSRIFDPFFSTKEQNKGSGLGLSIVYAIIKNQHKGEIFVESEPGKGTTFIIVLPEIPAQKEHEIDHRESEFLPLGDESILIIDDEEFLRQSIRILFEKLGYKTYLAGSGKEGIGILKQNPDINLAIVDLAMPGMDGIATINELKKIKENLGIVLITGYLEEINRLTETDLIDDICLKPFDIYELSTIVRKLLDKKIRV